MTAGSFHERHRSFLAAVTDPAVMAGVLGGIGIARGWWTTDRRWARTWGRLRSTPGGAQATVTYESRTPSVQICTLAVSEAPSGTADAVQVDAVRRFPDDAVLGSLVPVLDRFPGARVVRYRTGKRCTLQVSGGPLGPCFIKLFADARGAQCLADAAALLGASEAGRLAFAVAAPLDYDSAHQMYIQAAVPGESVVDGLYSAAGSALASRLGSSLGSLCTSGVRPSATLDHDAERVRANKRAEELSSLVPSIRAPIKSLLDDMDRVHRALRPKPLVPIHGSPHPHQWLMDGDTIGLIDFDRFSMGDAELDVATFAGEVDFQRNVPAAVINEAFVTGYESRAGRLDEQRLSLYRAHKRFAKACRTARAINIAGHERASAHLDRAHQALACKEAVS